jgi:transposase
VGRGELTDTAWARIEPLLPVATGRGGRWRDHRQVINAILWRLRTGAPWRDVPAKYGPWKTAHERLRLWTADGTWDKILDHVQVKDDAVGKVEWVFSVDSTHVRLITMRREPAKRGLSDRVGQRPRPRG